MQPTIEGESYVQVYQILTRAGFGHGHDPLVTGQRRLG